MHGRESFLAIRRHGVRARAGAISVAFLPDAATSPPAVGYAVSRRIGNAVARNRLRRRLRAAVAELAGRQPSAVADGLYVVTPAPGAASLSFPQLRATLAAALEKSQHAASLAGSGR